VPLFDDQRPALPQGRRISPKGRELLRRVLQTGSLYTRGAGEASSRRALLRAGLLDESIRPAPEARALAGDP